MQGVVQMYSLPFVPVSHTTGATCQHSSPVSDAIVALPTCSGVITTMVTAWTGDFDGCYALYHMASSAVTSRHEHIVAAWHMTQAEPDLQLINADA